MIAPFDPAGVAPLAGVRPHVLTVALEDYFQVGAFNKFVQKNQWYRFETRLEQNTLQTLALLARYDATATFFVLGWVAKRFPELVRLVADAGHEVATKGYYHRGVRELAPEEFRADCERAKSVVEDAAGQKVVGYRLADGWLGPQDLWALDTLAECGFGYDSSLAPMGNVFAGQPFRRHPHEHDYRGKRLWEVPVSTAKMFGCTVPVAGGNYLRQLPAWVTRRAVERWERTEPGPLVAYFHVWELDPEQPRLAIGSRFTQARHYRNLHRMPGRLAELLARRRFTSVADYLGLSTRPDPARPSARLWHSDSDLSARPTGLTPLPAQTMAPGGRATPVTVVVPCFNEEESVPYLANTLARVRESLADRYEVRFLLVDDGSTDQTWAALQARYRDAPGYTLHRHPANEGVAAAIMTGIRRADTEVVASIDCDCTYDPVELRNMLPLLVPGVDLVTASPYHANGHVRNVPAWRLGLSKGAAWLYRRILRHKLATYTSCFRVYRRSSVAGLTLTHGRFLGVAELVGRLDLTGGTIVEHPATLEVRMLGRSKMKTVRTVVGHLRLMAKLARVRMTGAWARGHRDAVIRSVVQSHVDDRPVLVRRSLAPFASDDVRRVVVNAPAPEPRRPEVS